MPKTEGNPTTVVREKPEPETCTERREQTPTAGKNPPSRANRCRTGPQGPGDNAMETVNHPPHYNGDTVYEAIKVIEAWGLDFCLGNCLKYIARYGRKDPDKLIEDLEKARWYLDRKIQQLKK
jgi:hypothetical protein